MKDKLFIGDEEIPGKKLIFYEFHRKPMTIHATQMHKEFEIDAVEGTFRGEAGDWLIRGIEGELSLCNDEMFRETYKEA